MTVFPEESGLYRCNTDTTALDSCNSDATALDSCNSDATALNPHRSDPSNQSDQSGRFDISDRSDISDRFDISDRSDLSELITENDCGPICDLHIHILPDVDDGAQELPVSVGMARACARQGVRAIFATPHHYACIDDSDRAHASEAFDMLSKALSDEQLPVRLYTGCEICCMVRWMDRILEGLKDGRYPTLNHTRYVLIEFPMWNTSLTEVEYCLAILINAGYIPVLAHAERYADSFSSVEVIRQLKQLGCLIQLNTYSLLEEPEASIRTLAQDLLHDQLVDFIGSDGHGPFHRPPFMKTGLTYIKKNCSKEYARKIFWDNAVQLGII